MQHNTQCYLISDVGMNQILLRYCIVYRLENSHDLTTALYNIIYQNGSQSHSYANKGAHGPMYMYIHTHVSYII